jgi:hypothetical protein
LFILGHLPGLVQWHFLATSSRYHRKIVSGVAIVASADNPFLPKRQPKIANRLRSAQAANAA